MFAGDNIHAVQTVFLLLLVFVAGFALLARRIKVAYPIVLVIAGLLVSFVPRAPRIVLQPEFIFLIFLPPLLYAAAGEVSWREFRDNAFTVGMLAVGLVAFTVWGVAYFSEHFITALYWKSGFLLGAVVAATDSIAATSIARSLGLPRRIVDVLEGESLFNDATALLALEFGLRLLIRGESPTIGAGLLRLAYLSFVGALVGLAIAYVFSKFNGLIDDGPVQIVVSLVVPYAAYLGGESVHASGVIAVVVCGLYVGRQNATIYSPNVRLQVHGVWNALTFILNGIVFTVIGLQLPLVLTAIRGEYGWSTLAEYGILFSVVLIVLRLAWTYSAAWGSYLFQAKILKRQLIRPGAKELFVIGWTGMRGVLALAAALSLPVALADGKPFAARNLILFLAFVVILVTLVLQGLTLPPLIRLLGLARPAGLDEEEQEARRIMLASAIAYLEQERGTDGQRFDHVYNDLLHRYRHRLAAVGGQAPTEGDLDADSYARLRSVAAGALQAERRSMIGLRDEGRISDDALRSMEHELDLLASRYDSEAK